ncbi:hypothetical protein [Prosthecochloris sp.]|uniref:hypothetical protein n=1 Tax=Prosthecochloris sp. TaxID=290513 RepID=UPI00260119D0|nr:hypothetical protein [Prosthecochloris sp.]
MRNGDVSVTALSKAISPDAVVMSMLQPLIERNPIPRPLTEHLTMPKKQHSNTKDQLLAARPVN